MTLWFCDRCGKQVKKDSYGAGKYSIQKTFSEIDSFGGITKVQRFLKFCDNCSGEIEKFLDDEMLQIPSVLSGTVDKRC